MVELFILKIKLAIEEINARYVTFRVREFDKCIGRKPKAHRECPL